MTIPQDEEPTRQRPLGGLEGGGLQPLRLWPGVVIVALQWLVNYVVPLVVPGSGMAAALGAVLGGLGGGRAPAC